jgi:hypothetical protein
MTKWTLRLGVVVGGALLAGAAASAHHSLAGVYALGKEAKVSGTFKAFRLVNPHSTMKIDVRNILTFNPGWDSNARKPFTDVRELQRRLKAQGVELQQEADEGTTGPASFVAVDPDGNPILVDQHV